MGVRLIPAFEGQIFNFRYILRAFPVFTRRVFGTTSFSLHRNVCSFNFFSRTECFSSICWNPGSLRFSFIYSLNDRITHFSSGFSFFIWSISLFLLSLSPSRSRCSVSTIYSVFHLFLYLFQIQHTNRIHCGFRLAWHYYICFALSQLYIFSRRRILAPVGISGFTFSSKPNTKFLSIQIRADIQISSLWILSTFFVLYRMILLFDFRQPNQFLKWIFEQIIGTTHQKNSGFSASGDKACNKVSPESEDKSRKQLIFRMYKKRQSKRRKRAREKVDWRIFY